MHRIALLVFAIAAALLVGCRAGGGASSTGESERRIDISGVWRLVELHDWNPEGEDVSSLGVNAPGLFVYTPEGYLSLHIMTEHEREAVARGMSDAELGRIYRPYIGYFGMYDVDYEAMTVTHHIEGAKLPNRIGRSAVRAFYFEEGDLVLDFENSEGWRFYRRLERIEAFD